jgi:hypothetical protein
VEEQVATAVKPAKQDRTTMILLLIAAMVAVGGIAFAVGRVTAGTTTASTGDNNRYGGFPGGGREMPSLAPGQTLNPGQFPGGNQGGPNGQAMGMGGAVSGTVQSIDANSITIKLSSGSTVTVSLTGTTTYHSETTASASDVKAGSTVRVTIDASGLGGMPNPSASGDRTVTAGDVLIETP